MAVNLTPLHDRVVVKRIEEKETVKGGIIIPDSAKEKQHGRRSHRRRRWQARKGRTDPSRRQAGDRVLFGKYSGTEIKIDDEEL